MCIPGGEYVALNVYERLVSRGVAPDRARGVAMKVRRRYEQKAREGTRTGGGHVSADASFPRMDSRRRG